MCVCECVHQGVGALVRVRQQRVPQLSRNLSQATSLTERESSRERRGPGDELRGKEEKKRKRMNEDQSVEKKTDVGKRKI